MLKANVKFVKSTLVCSTPDEMWAKRIMRYYCSFLIPAEGMRRGQKNIAQIYPKYRPYLARTLPT